MPSKSTEELEAAETIAAIDIGSNSIHMVVAQVLSRGQIQVLERLSRGVRLGHDTFRIGRLQGKTMRSVVSVFRDYLKVLDTYGVKRVRAVATSAVREATNGDVFVDRILMSTGLEVSVISVAEEARLTILAVRNAAGSLLAKRNALVVKVGGGSTILSLLRRGGISTSQNMPIGSVRLQEVLATSTEPAEHAAKLIHHQISSAVSAFKGMLDLKKIQTFVAIGADARWAATQIRDSGNTDRLSMVTREDLGRLASSCQKHTADELARMHGMSYANAETLVPALLVYQILLSQTRAKRLIVPDVTMRDSLLLELAKVSTEELDESVSREVIESAIAIAEKYKVDMQHALHVRDLASRLFSEMESDHGLNERHRLMLEAAAILHEIGTFVSSRAHHKHTLYLVANSEVLGLNQEELLIVANVARYHRRSRPKPSHAEYTALPRESRIVVNRLAALLRVADALDTSRTKQVTDFWCSIGNEGLAVAVQAGADLTLEKRALSQKSDMFQDIYGLTVHIEEREL